MSLQRVSVSVPLADPAIDLDSVIPVFHEWIRRGAVAGLLIDVARYGHVHNGPGIMLIGHEGDYSIDMADGTPALRYTLKRHESDTPQAAVALAVQRLTGAISEAAAAGFATVTGDVTVQVFDRLVAPNTDETATSMSAMIVETVAQTAGIAVRQADRLSDDPRAPFALRLVAAAA